MDNPLEAIGHGIKVGVVDAGKGIAKGVDVAIVQPIEFAVHAEKVIATAVKDQPIVRDAITALIKQATAVVNDFKTDIGDVFIDLKADEQTLKDAEAFFNWFKASFIPAIEKVYGDISADVG
jgi:hypothetical protein